MAENPHDNLPVPKAASSRTPNENANANSVGQGPAPDPETLVEVYRTDNEMAALFVRDEILGPVGIFVALHNRRSASFMAPASMPGEIGIAVAADQAAVARTRLKAARQDGALLDGQLIEEGGA
jgi:hypothetical protein